VPFGHPALDGSIVNRGVTHIVFRWEIGTTQQELVACVCDVLDAGYMLDFIEKGTPS
jgi:hypothetical protein